MWARFGRLDSDGVVVCAEDNPGWFAVDVLDACAGMQWDVCFAVGEVGVLVVAHGCYSC